jgi:hypothetical protein
MSRSYKSKSSRTGWDKELPYIKRLCRRLFRAQTRRAIRDCRFDLMPIRRGTEGWITW